MFLEVSHLMILLRNLGLQPSVNTSNIASNIWGETVRSQVYAAASVGKLYEVRYNQQHLAGNGKKLGIARNIQVQPIYGQV